MTPNLDHRIRLIGFFLFSAILLFACVDGSDDDGDSRSDGQIPPVTGDHADVKQVMGSITASRIVSTMVSQLSNQVSPIRRDQNSRYNTIMAATIDDQRACTVSGTSSIHMSWQGPDAQALSSCEEVSDVTATLTLSACIEQDKPQVEQSMTISVFKDGSLCRPEIIDADVSDLHVIDTGDADLDFQSDALHIDMTEIAYSDDDNFMTHANVSLTGNAAGTRGDRRYAAQFDNFRQIIDTDDNHQFTATFSGRIQSDCMDQWADVQTTTPIQFRDQECPSQGAIRITIGSEAVTVRYHSDGSATIGDTRYDSCRHLEEACNG
jgi:hypothetical protein